MRIVVIGAGAVGSLLGHVLATAGFEVLVLSRSAPAVPERVTWTRVEPDGTEHPAVVRVGGTAGIQALDAPDLVIVAVKQYHLGAALDSLSPWPDAPTMTVQNGVGAEEVAAIARPAAPVIAASFTASCALPAPGRIVRLTNGGIGLAAASGDPGPVLPAVVDAFEAGGLRAVRHAHAPSMKWSKLLGNLVANALGAVVDLEPAAIYRDQRLFALEREQLREASRVMGASGLRPVALPGAPIPWLARAARLPAPVARLVLARVVGGARGGKSPSLREHVRSGAPPPTEVGWLNGAVTAAGRRLAIETPVNDALVHLVDEVVSDPERRAWFAGRPDRVVEAIAASR